MVMSDKLPACRGLCQTSKKLRNDKLAACRTDARYAGSSPVLILDEGQYLSSSHFSQSGFLALHIRRP